MALAFASYGFWRLRRGRRERRFGHLFFEITERKNPFRFKYELYFLFLFTGMSFLFVLIGLVVTTGLLFEVLK